MTDVSIKDEKTIPVKPKSGSKRIVSIDFFRGLDMFLLIGSAAGLYHLMRESNVEIISFLGFQFKHAHWIGLTFWDLVEPFFMFIVGAAIPFSVMKRLDRGDPWSDIFKHALQRSIILFFLGIVYYSISAGKPVFKLWNILTQLGFTYFIAFLLVRKPIKVQVMVSLLLILVYDLLYQFWPVAGFNQPFVPDHNFGAWFDMQVMGMLESDHWVSPNFISMAAFSIWGAISGLILKSDRTNNQKVKILAVTGIIGIAVGFGMGFYIPMIKRIATSSYVIIAGGWCFLAMAFSFWLIDVKGFKKVPTFFVIVGMNPLFIYLFDQFGGSAFLAHIIKPFTYGLFMWMGEGVFEYATAILTWLFLWYLCYWLYKHKILIKI